MSMGSGVGSSGQPGMSTWGDYMSALSTPTAGDYASSALSGIGKGLQSSSSSMFPQTPMPSSKSGGPVAPVDMGGLPTTSVYGGLAEMMGDAMKLLSGLTAPQQTNFGGAAPYY